MALPKSTLDREKAKFVENSDGDVAVRILGETSGLNGASTNGTTQLTGANTWVQVPTTAPTSSYVLVVTKENEAGVIRWSFENGATPSATNGNKMWNDDIIISLGASEVVYFGSTDAGDDVNWTTKEI